MINSEQAIKYMMQESAKLLTHMFTKGYKLETCRNKVLFRKEGNTKDASIPSENEVSIANIPHCMTPHEILELVMIPGVVVWASIKMQPCYTGNRGFAYVEYCASELADNACNILNNVEIKDKRLCVQKTNKNKTLFVGGIPYDLTQKDVFLKLLQSKMYKVKDVYVYRSLVSPNKSRGFAFVYFDSHKSASEAKKYIAHDINKKFGRKIHVDWGTQIPEIDPNELSKVCNIFLNGLPVGLPFSEFRSTIHQLLNDVHYCRIYKNRDYAFIHFPNREEAVRGFERLKQLAAITVQWARPVTHVNFSNIGSMPVLIQDYSLKHVTAPPVPQNEEVDEFNDWKLNLYGKRHPLNRKIYESKIYVPGIGSGFTSVMEIDNTSEYCHINFREIEDGMPC